jgi:tetratricopeptide (TPR) repeat protein
MLAHLYLARGEDGLAEQQLLTLVQSSPKDLLPRLQLAGFYVQTKRLNDAERTLKAAPVALPQSSEAKLAYVEFLALYRSPAQGEAALSEFIARDRHNYDLQLRLGALQQQAGRTQEALTTYRALIAADPGGATGVAARDRIAAIDLMAGKDADAKPLLADALRSSPHDNDALTLRANLSLKEGDPVAAIADLRAVLHDQPQAIPVLRTLARAHLANHNPTLAEENLRSALAAAPHDLGVRVDLGELLTRTRRADQAAALLEETVRDVPEATGTAARAALIEAYLAKPDLPAARTAAEGLKALQPNLSTGWYLAGLVARQQKRPDDAQREFEHALQLQPSAAEVLTALVHLQLERGQQAQAILLLQGAIQRNPDNAATHNLLGESYFADRNYAGAARALEAAVRLAPNWWVPYGNLARARLATKDAAGGLAAYEAGVKATEEPALVVDLATTYEQQGRVEDAIRQYEVLHERRPQLELAANNLAMLLVTYHTDQASLDRARDLTAAFADSDVAALLDTHGWVMFKRGEMPEALSALQKAAAQAPNSKVILYHLGMAQLKSGQAEDARASLEAALAGGGSFAGAQEARIALAQLKRRSG